MIRVLPPKLWGDANRAFYESRVWTTLTDDEGRRICKYPTDLWAYEEVIRRTKPEVIVETGSFEGGSASWFAKFAEVVSVDINRPPDNIPGVTWIVGDSPKMADQVAALVAARSCLVTLDSDHNSRHVLAELEAYADLATDYLIVEDTAVDVYGLDAEWYLEGGPGRALQLWLSGHPEWQPDPECDRFLLGMNPGGWLRRVG